MSSSETPQPSGIPDSAAPCGKRYINRNPIDLDLSNSGLIVKVEDSRKLKLRESYLYVITLEGALILGDLIAANVQRKTLHHPDLVGGADVAYAGEIRLTKRGGGLFVLHWTRHSGHYHPNPKGDILESECIRRVLLASTWKFMEVPPEAPLPVV